MSIFDLFKEQRFFKASAEEAKQTQNKLPSLFAQCKACKQPIEKEAWKNSYGVCSHCEFHHPISWVERAAFIYDQGKYSILDSEVSSEDILSFTDRMKYKDRLDRYRKEGHVNDAFISTMGEIGGHGALVGFFNFKFLGGSMGSVVGEKVCRLFERGLGKHLPVIIFHETGGARMQEGLFSLFQMGKTSMVLNQFKSHSKTPFISVLTYPTTGGVAASFAISGDVNIAEQDALIGFAGKRVIEQAIRQPLPDGFQSAEYVLKKGMVDQVIQRKNLQSTLIQLIQLFGKHDIR